MADSITAFFRNLPNARRAYDALLAENYAQDEVSLLSADDRTVPNLGPRSETGSQSEVEPKAAIGGLAGLAVGVVAAVLPGVGPLLAIGPLAAAIGGSALGAAAGGIVGLLQNYGVSDADAEIYSEGVRRGGAIVSVHGVDGERADRARDIFEQRGAVNVERLKEEWTSERSPTGSLGTERM